MTTLIPRAAVLEILRTPAASDTFPDMIRRVEALEGCGASLEDAYALGFEASGEGWNGEYPTADFRDDPVWQSYRDKNLAALEPVAQPETPIPGQFETMCLAIEDAVTGRVFDVDPWQPIETAPRDGTWFLAGTAGAEWQRPRIVKFYDDHDRFPMHEDMRPWSVAPTHWQPITKPGETTSAIPDEVKAYLRNALMVGGWRGECD